VEVFLDGAVLEGKQWDVIVLDPPKLAPRRCVHVSVCMYAMTHACMW